MGLKSKIKIFMTLLSLMLLVSGCSNNISKNDNINESLNESKKETVSESNKESSKDSENISNEIKSNNIEIEDNRGKHSVPVNPKSVVILDSRSFETISDWNIKIAAAPKLILPEESPIKRDESVKDIGNHREPNFELLAAENPEVVIIGQRFSQHYDTIKSLLPNSIILDIDISLNSKDSGTELINGLKKNTEILGKIFNKEIEAKSLIERLDKSIENLKAKKTEDKFTGVIVSGGKIGYSAPGSGRVWGPVFSEFGLKSALNIDNASSDHKGDDISVEAIAQSNPDVLLVMDRDASYASNESKPAKDVIEGSKVLENTNAIKNKKIFYAPKDIYANESIQTWIEMFENLAAFIEK